MRTLRLLLMRNIRSVLSLLWIYGHYRFLQFGHPLLLSNEYGYGCQTYPHSSHLHSIRSLDLVKGRSILIFGNFV